MTQTLLLVVLFVGGMAMLPWLVKWLQQRRAGWGGAAHMPPKVLSGVSVGPQQRVVVVEVGVDAARTVLVLGVTAHQVSCLHVLVPAGSVTPVPSTVFSQVLAAAESQPQPRPSGEESHG